MAKKVAIIGAGVAGMMAAYRAAEGGAEVDLYDKNPNIGRKFVYVPWDYCELSHTGEIEDFMENYAHGAEFISYSLEKFNNKELVKFLKDLGINTITSEDGVISPENGDSELIQKAFYERLSEMGVSFCMSSKVQKILAKSKKIIGIYVHNLEKEYDKVIVACGGAARPKLGGSEDGFKLAEELGHTVIDAKPAVSPVDTEERLGKYLSGLKLPSVNVSVYSNQTKLMERSGSVLFTDHGLSGDTVLFLSGIISRLIENNKIELGIDIIPGITREELERKLKSEASLSNRNSVGEALKKYIPEKMLPVLPRYCRIHSSKPMNHITNLERKGLILFLKDMRITVKRVKPFFEAMYTSGGVDVVELNPKSMESKLIKGLYFCGEIMDVDGGVGGYNIHSAFASGHIAGKSAARGAKAKKAAAKKAENPAEDTSEKAKTSKKKKAARKKSAKKKTARKKKAAKKKSTGDDDNSSSKAVA
ncbi:MAG: aminoacetone oxidase family FAD-binding enzyme [candidate division Zixibacteria bacterium]|nr:aminoacetone oxidase family FAD-binding enzyme [candidate division Zixibacteria bacterium]